MAVNVNNLTEAVNRITMERKKERVGGGKRTKKETQEAETKTTRKKRYTKIQRQKKKQEMK
jgi:hypothetical protein